MLDDDRFLAKFPPRFDGVAVELWFCPHMECYALKWSHAGSEVREVVTYSATDLRQVRDCLLDAEALASGRL